MPSSKTSHTSICVFVGLVVVAILMLLAAAHAAPLKPKGMFLPIARHFPAQTSPSDVQPVQYPTPPYKTLGYVRVELDYVSHLKKTELRMLQKAKELAAARGANGLTNIKIGSMTYGGHTIYMLTSVAIRSQ